MPIIDVLVDNLASVSVVRPYVLFCIFAGFISVACKPRAARVHVIRLAVYASSGIWNPETDIPWLLFGPVNKKNKEHLLLEMPIKKNRCFGNRSAPADYQFHR
jgi:hypothetical protein